MSDNCSMGTAQAPNKKGEYSYTADRRERPLFRLIDHWKRESISGSFRIGNKFRFQAHSTIGKCFPIRWRRRSHFASIVCRHRC